MVYNRLSVVGCRLSSNSAFHKKLGKGVGRILQLFHVGYGLDGLIGRKFLCFFDVFGDTHDDAAGVKIVVEGFALAQELG